MSRLENISHPLVALLYEASEEHRRAACLAACEFAVQKSGVDSPVVECALEALRQSQPVPPQMKQEMKSLAERLDEEYFDLLEASENVDARENGWKRAFSQARAVSALVFASGEYTIEAACEAVYEAIVSVEEGSELIAVVTKALAA